MERMVGVLMCASLLLASGCASTGVFFSSTVTPTEHRLQTEGHELGAKRGKACVQSIMGVAAFGDASVAAAAADAGITKVGSVDKKKFNVLFFYMQRCTIVTGT